MSELATRARELANEWSTICEVGSDNIVEQIDEFAALIEQALLAERAIALTEASKMLVFLEREDESFEGTDDEFWNYAASEGVAQYRKHIKGLLATPRGGE